MRIILTLNNFLNDSEYSFIRLIKSGIQEEHCIDEDLGLHEMPYDSSNYFLFPTSDYLEKKELRRLYDAYRPKNMMDSELYGSSTARSLGIRGCYVYKGENKRGRLHHDSSTFPYIATALHGGSHGRPAKWQTALYKKELGKLFKKYNINPDLRGEC